MYANMVFSISFNVSRTKRGGVVLTFQRDTSYKIGFAGYPNAR